MKAPTFEERCGPWICMGCGLAHKLGKPCPTDPPKPKRGKSKPLVGLTIPERGGAARG